MRSSFGERYAIRKPLIYIPWVNSALAFQVHFWSTLQLQFKDGRPFLETQSLGKQCIVAESLLLNHKEVKHFCFLQASTKKSLYKFTPSYKSGTALLNTTTMINCGNFFLLLWMKGVTDCCENLETRSWQWFEVEYWMYLRRLNPLYNPDKTFRPSNLW